MACRRDRESASNCPDGTGVDHASGDPESYRRAVALLRKYAAPSDVQGALKLARCWTIIGLILGFSLIAVPEDTYLRVALFAISVTAIGVAMGALESCAHEATHYTLFRTRRLNNDLQILFAAPVLESVEDYRESHVIHHRELGGPRDPAMQLYAETGVHRLPDRFLWIMFVRPLLGYHVWHFLRRTITMIRTRPSCASHLAAFWLPVVSIAVYFELGWWLLCYALFPLFYVLPILLFWAEVLDHVGLAFGSRFRAARTHIGSLSLIFYPHGEGYHLIHHLHPGIPSHRLEAAHHELVAANWLAARMTAPVTIGDSLRNLRRDVRASSRVS